MAQILPETEVTEVEGRTYINPQAALGESDTFIDNLRQTQQANTQQKVLLIQLQFQPTKDTI